MRMRPERSAADLRIGSRGHAGTVPSANLAGYHCRASCRWARPIGVRLRRKNNGGCQYVAARGEPLDCERISMAVASYALGRGS
jgi:hypothetical protein